MSPTPSVTKDLVTSTSQEGLGKHAEDQFLRSIKSFCLVLVSNSLKASQQPSTSTTTTTSTTPIVAKNSATNASQVGLGECTGGPTAQEREVFCLALMSEVLFEDLRPKKVQRRRPPPKEKTKTSPQRRIEDEDLRLKKSRRPTEASTPRRYQTRR